MKDETFNLLIDSLKEAKAHAKGEKTGVRVTNWEIIPVNSFTAKDVKRIRKKVGISQPMFAELLGVSVKTVRSWEQDLATPSGAASRMLEALDKSCSETLKLYSSIDVIRRVG